MQGVQLLRFNEHSRWSSFSSRFVKSRWKFATGLTLQKLNLRWIIQMSSCLLREYCSGTKANEFFPILFICCIPISRRDFQWCWRLSKNTVVSLKAVEDVMRKKKKFEPIKLIGIKFQIWIYTRRIWLHNNAMIFGTDCELAFEYMINQSNCKFLRCPSKIHFDLHFFRELKRCILIRIRNICGGSRCWTKFTGNIISRLRLIK